MRIHMIGRIKCRIQNKFKRFSFNQFGGEIRIYTKNPEIDVNDKRK